MANISFCSKKTIESKTMPGVSFTIRQISDAVRTRLRLALAKPLADLRSMQNELEAIPLPKTPDGAIDNEAAVDPAVLSQILDLHDRIRNLTAAEIDPHYVKQALVKIEGIEIDGVSEVGADLLRESGPEELYREVVDAIKAEASLSSEERRNLGSPTTSAAEAGGQMIVIDAAPAGSQETQ